MCPVSSELLDTSLDEFIGLGVRFHSVAISAYHLRSVQIFKKQCGLLFVNCGVPYPGYAALALADFSHQTCPLLDTSLKEVL